MPKIIVKYIEIKPFYSNIEIEKNLNKNNVIEKPKEIKDIKISNDFCNKKTELKYPENDTLPIIVLKNQTNNSFN